MALNHRGAEAVVTSGEWLDHPAVIKRRNPRRYRHPDLERRLVAERREAAALLMQVQYRRWSALCRVRGFTPSRGLGAFVRFWGGPVWSGFIIVRARLGALTAQWRGFPNGNDD